MKHIHPGLWGSEPGVEGSIRHGSQGKKRKEKAKPARAERGGCAGSHCSQAFNSSPPRRFCIGARCRHHYNSIYRLTTWNNFQGKGWVSHLLNLNLPHGLLIFPSLESTPHKSQVSDGMRVCGEEDCSCALEMVLAATVIHLFIFIFVLPSIATERELIQLSLKNQQQHQVTEAWWFCGWYTLISFFFFFFF